MQMRLAPRYHENRELRQSLLSGTNRRNQLVLGMVKGRITIPTGDSILQRVQREGCPRPNARRTVRASKNLPWNSWQMLHWKSATDHCASTGTSLPCPGSRLDVVFYFPCCSFPSRFRSETRAMSLFIINSKEKAFPSHLTNPQEYTLQLPVEQGHCSSNEFCCQDGIIMCNLIQLSNY